MKKGLLEMLICPSCLPHETRLTKKIEQEEQDDIMEGSLNCEKCGRDYPIRDGLAYLTPANTYPENQDNPYETASVLSSYLWSHYGDLLKDPDVSTAYADWADLVHRNDGLCLDIGSAVGRFSFEMTKKSQFVVGLDNSVSFIKAARELMRRGQKTLTIPREGLLNDKKILKLPPFFHTDRAEFIVADAQALPFRSGLFSMLSSLNIVDKVPKPLTHLTEMNRVATDKTTQFLFSDPFSWSTKVTGHKNWLGGVHDGPYSGKGLENILALLQGKNEKLLPRWEIEKKGHVWWKIRTHRNHFELIRSCFIKAAR